ncbi:hypothetical protein [Luteipulveratus halotolerans]|uniref:hypothetical protein n=1 Tax=Luteipulveratus halotolerans TaxID=1631356 RepID=UPI0012FAD4FE|nr:hypothetical protein [Luteipulveratus halotolerans]
MLARDLNQVERRCVLMHELVHDERGIPEVPSAAEEAAVEREVARRLIPLNDLLRVARMCLPAEEAAEELWVTEDVLTCRLASLDGGERFAWRAMLADLAEHEPC